MLNSVTCPSPYHTVITTMVTDQKLQLKHVITQTRQITRCFNVIQSPKSGFKCAALQQLDRSSI